MVSYSEPNVQTFSDHGVPIIIVQCSSSCFTRFTSYFQSSPHHATVTR